MNWKTVIGYILCIPVIILFIYTLWLVSPKINQAIKLLFETPNGRIWLIVGGSVVLALIGLTLLLKEE